MAQLHYYQLAKRKGRKVSCTPDIKQDIGSQLRASWSPEQISSWNKSKPMVAFKKIYNWLYKCIISCDLSVLRCKEKS